MIDYRPGMRVLIDRQSCGSPTWLTVERVGRKWVLFVNQPSVVRVERGATVLVEQGYGKIGDVYESQEALDAHKIALRVERRRREALDTLSWYALPLEKINQVYDIIFPAGSK